MTLNCWIKVYEITIKLITQINEKQNKQGVNSAMWPANW
mgnify:CR=1 FL=1